MQRSFHEASVMNNFGCRAAQRDYGMQFRSKARQDLRREKVRRMSVEKVKGKKNIENTTLREAERTMIIKLERWDQGGSGRQSCEKKLSILPAMK